MSGDRMVFCDKCIEHILNQNCPIGCGCVFDFYRHEHSDKYYDSRFFNNTSTMHAELEQMSVDCQFLHYNELMDDWPHLFFKYTLPDMFHVVGLTVT